MTKPDTKTDAPLNGLLKDYESPEASLGEHGLLQVLTSLVECVLSIKSVTPYGTWSEKSSAPSHMISESLTALRRFQKPKTVLERFAKTWDQKYPTINARWRRDWEQLTVFFDYPPKDIGKLFLPQILSGP